MVFETEYNKLSVERRTGHPYTRAGYAVRAAAMRNERLHVIRGQLESSRYDVITSLIFVD